MQTININPSAQGGVQPAVQQVQQAIPAQGPIGFNIPLPFKDEGRAVKIGMATWEILVLALAALVLLVGIGIFSYGAGTPKADEATVRTKVMEDLAAGNAAAAADARAKAAEAQALADRQALIKALQDLAAKK